MTTLIGVSFAIAMTAVSAHALTVTDSARIARVFPFEVGQQYEYQGRVTFHRPNGDTLAPRTVATITVTDTIIDDKTWLHVPCWSPFGTEYYRIDDSLRV